MFSKLEDLEKKYEKIKKLLCDPGVISDQNKYKDVMKNYKSFESIMEKYKEYKKLKKDETETLGLIKNSKLEKDFVDMANEDLKETRAKIEKTSLDLKVLLLPQDERDDKNVVIEIRSGAGGEEAALFSSVLYRMYNMYAESKNFKSELVYINETGLGGFKEVDFIISGKGAYSRFKYESGVHRVQRVPETETQGRIHTSTVTVAILPEADDVEVDVKQSDLQIDTFRASGAGGQHVNKTESAIRITHVPTGLVIECQDERSQYKNKEKAMKVLKSRLLELKTKEQQGKTAQERRFQIGTGDRSERIRTYNYPQGRVTDHRIKLTLYKLESILNGDLDEIIDSLTTAEKTLKLQS
ncbi:MAG: peptide chain release factor 1 [Oscillospiraceae bacterium]|jgi:peptide chain release factor 1|nr:peptide chain release factor 1 [Oscillospiraceae bacterium]